jgi:hypothetical protein
MNLLTVKSFIILNFVIWDLINLIKILPRFTRGLVTMEISTLFAIPFWVVLNFTKIDLRDENPFRYPNLLLKQIGISINFPSQSPWQWKRHPSCVSISNWFVNLSSFSLEQKKNETVMIYGKIIWAFFEAF